MRQRRVAERVIPAFVLMWVAIVLIGHPSKGSAAEVVVPNAQTTARGNGNNVYPFSCASLPSMRYQQVYAAAEVGSGTITQIAFRQFSAPAFTGTLLGVTLTLSSTSNGPDTLSATFAANVGADVKTVFSGDLTLSGSATTFPPTGPFDARIPLQTPFTFDAGTGKNLLLDVTIRTCGVTGLFEAQALPGDSVSRVYSLNAAATTAVGNDTLGLITQFTIEPAGPPPPPTALVAAVLPNARAVQVGTPVTVNATIINAGGATAVQAGISLATPVPASFGYWLLDTSVNPPQLVGAPNTPVDIPACAPPAPCPHNDFLIFMTPAGAFGPTELVFTFAGINTPPVASLVGINTLLLLASATPTPDMVALAATSSNNGIAQIPGVTGTGVFVVATTNLGIGDTITVSADTGAAVVPVDVTICETNSATGACLAVPAPTVTTFAAAGAQPTFGFFVRGLGVTIPLDPAVNRVFARFRRSDSLIVGGTSVAVMTQ